jgi:hypothetical protein
MVTEQPINQAQNNNEAPHSKVTFSPEQQQRIDEIVRDAMGRSGREVRLKAEQLQQELDAARQAVADIHEQSRTKDKELAATLAIASDQKLTIAIEKAAKDANFVSMDAVRRLTSGNVKYDHTGNIIVVDDKGNQLLNSEHQPMTLQEFYQNYAATHAFLVKSDVKGGAGSAPSSQHGSRDTIRLEQVFGRGSSAELANKLAQSDPIRYRTLKAQARAQGLI